MQPRDIRDPATLKPQLGLHTWFVDCGVFYDSTLTSVISGLDHLEGREVTGLGWKAGEKVGSISGTVTGGELDLGTAEVNTAIVGIGFVSKVKTLRVSTGDTFNTLQGEEKNITETTLRVKDTTTVMIGQSEDGLASASTLSIENNDSGVDTGDFKVTPSGGYNTNGQLVVQVDGPFPVTIQAIIMEIDQ